MPLFRVHKIDGKELDRIREKNDSKVCNNKAVLLRMYYIYVTKLALLSVAGFPRGRIGNL